MNTLTPNMIIEKGDEYLHKDGQWRPVTENHIGLQVYFAVAQIRRPSKEKWIKPTELEIRAGSIGRMVPVPQQGSQVARQESAKLPIAGSIPAPASTIPEYTPETAKAVQTFCDTALSPDSEKPTPSGAGTPSAITIKFTGTGTSDEPIWTGRNGTFKGMGVWMQKLEGSLNVSLFPIGKRGTGNCCIQFPTSIIPQVVDWLLRQQTK